MDILTGSILSGIIYDGVKNGARISFDMLKSKLQGWIIDDDQIKCLVNELKNANINEDLAPHAIERKINNHQPLVELLKEVRASNELTQKSNIGHNINSSGNGNISVGSIIVKTDDS